MGLSSTPCFCSEITNLIVWSRQLHFKMSIVMGQLMGIGSKIKRIDGFLGINIGINNVFVKKAILKNDFY